MSPDAHWRRNLFAITGACFIGFTGFTLVMPFLPLYFTQLGLTDVGEIAFWSGISLGITPAMTALLSPLWGTAVGSLRPQDHGRAVAGLLRHHDGGVGLRDEAVARLRDARVPRLVRRLRRAGPGDGGRIGAAGQDGLGDRHGADGAAPRPGARAGHRRRARAARGLAQRVLLRVGVLRRSACCSCSSCITSRTTPARSAAKGDAAKPRGEGARHVQERARVRALRAADGRDLRDAVRRQEPRPDSAALHRGAGRPARARADRLRHLVLGARRDGVGRPSPDRQDVEDASAAHDHRDGLGASPASRFCCSCGSRRSPC